VKKVKKPRRIYQVRRTSFRPDLLLGCVDPRVKSIYATFLKNELEITAYEEMLFPGFGLLLADEAVRSHKLRRIELFLKKGVKRIIFISHTDCAADENIAGQNTPQFTLEKTQATYEILSALCEVYKAQLVVYVAVIRNDNQIIEFYPYEEYMDAVTEGTNVFFQSAVAA
jgi:hypothetical protein